MLWVSGTFPNYNFINNSGKYKVVITFFKEMQTLIPEG